MPDGVNIPGGPAFIGLPQPPDVPCDPTGDGWRGPPGPPGPSGVGVFLPLVGGTMTGPIVLPGDPTTALQAASKHYVDQQTAVGTPPGGPFLPLGGGTVTGATTFSATPLTIGSASLASNVNIEVYAAANQQLGLQLNNAGLRNWSLIRDNTAIGNNTGANLQVNAYSDTGVFKDTLFTASRGSGTLGTGGPYFSKMQPRVMLTNRAIGPNGTYGDQIPNLTDQQPTTTLAANPITTYNGGTTVTITWAGCCGSNGPVDTTKGEVWVKIAGMTPFNGVNLNTGGYGGLGWYRVSLIAAPNQFNIVYDVPASAAGSGGGAAVTIRPSFSSTLTSVYSTALTGGTGYPIQYSANFSALPQFLPLFSTGTVGPDYEQWYTEFYTPPETSGNYAYHSIQWESDFVNRGADLGYSPNPFTTNNSTTAIWFTPLATPTPPRVSEGGTPNNWGSVLTFSGTANIPNNLRCAAYNPILVLPNATVGKGHDPTSHGGVSIDLFGSYEYMPINPFTTASGTSTVTCKVQPSSGAGALVGMANGDSVYIPNVYAFNGVTFGGASYTIANVNVAQQTFTITASGTASASSSAGGTTASLYFDKRAPFAPLQVTGQWRHGIYTAPDSRFEDGLVVHARPGQGVGWDDGTGIASINSSAASAGNINVVLTPAGTGAVMVAGAAGPTITSGSGVPASTQPKGSLYCRTGGAVATTLYVSQGGGTWNPVAGV